MGNVKDFPIIQVVGYKNSGKTTLIENLLIELVKNNWQFGVLKHHGHGGFPVLLDEGTDTYKYRTKGANATAVEGAGFFQLSVNGQKELSLVKMIDFFKMLSLHGLIIEGFKQADYPKIVLVREKEDLGLLDEISNIMFIIYWDKKMIRKTELRQKQFVIGEKERYLTFIVDWLKGAIK